MHTMFMNSGISKTSYPNWPLLNLFDKINLERSDKYIALPSLSISYTWKKLKSHTKTINLRYQLLCGITNFNYLINRILY